MVKMGNVWDRTAEFLSDNLGVLTPVALFAVFTPLTILFNLVPLVQSGSTGSYGVACVMLLLAIYLRGGLLTISTLAANPGLPSDRAVRLALQRLPLMVGLMVAYLVVLWLLSLPLSLILAANGLSLEAAQASGAVTLSIGASWGIAAALLAWIGLAIWLGARVGVLTQPIVASERAGVRTVARAWRLSRGLAVPIIGVALLYSVVSLVSVLAAQIVFGSVLRLFGGGDGSISVATVLTSVAAAVVASGFMILANAFTAKLYLAARSVEERASPIA